MGENSWMQLVRELFDGVDQAGRGVLYFVAYDGDVAFADGGKFTPDWFAAELIQMVRDSGAEIVRCG